VARTRFGCCALYVAECFTMIELDTNVRDVSELKCPTTTTGMSDWKSAGGLVDALLSSYDVQSELARANH